MEEAFRARLQAKLDGYQEWARGRTLSRCRLVQYSGVQLAGAHNVPIAEVESLIEQLVCEGFYVDWAEHEGQLVLKVWEFGGPEPEWSKVLDEQPLADIEAILEKSGTTPDASRHVGGSDQKVAGSARWAAHLGFASLICALIFPATFWGLMFADENGMLGPAPAGARAAMALFLAASSLLAVALGLLALIGGVRATALIGMIVGAAELIICMGFTR
jgi:hypothetical protein